MIIIVIQHELSFLKLIQRLLCKYLPQLNYEHFMKKKKKCAMCHLNLKGGSYFVYARR